MEKVTIEVYKCDTCGNLYYNESSAIECCKINKCTLCGKEISKHKSICDECVKKEQIENATKYTYKEYKEKYPNNYIYYNENYYNDLEDLLEFNEKDKLENPIYGTYEEIIRIDIKEVINDAEYNSDVEDFQFNNTKELIDFVEEWNKENSRPVYYVNKNIIIDISEEI